MNRETRVLEVVVEAVDTMLDDYDLIDFLQRLCERCVELLDVSAVGVMLVDHSDTLQLIAASDEHTRLLELFALQHDEGPCVECHRTGHTWLNVDLNTPAATVGFPAFAAAAREAGFATTHALPMSLRQQVIGALNLFHRNTRTLTPADVRLAQALADVATIAILQQRTIDRHAVERQQLEAALNSRITIEQAKGVLAERWQTDPDTAFTALRRHARSNRIKLSELAAQITSGAFDTETMDRT
ncbi:ANTAR domain-containing protein [Streptomyces xanthophaeus]|uniref:Transcriptional regulator n=1 Tax=Streptomyces xanthophaeus TaxID=67385 RepID=A0A919LD10_9ACTN|nr:GAF and ANTAR domain-containing protein [Streptomyces xanthophaeus]GHI85911.1 transcriptional regulator [Streptomyces xanthophaeus]